MKTFHVKNQRESRLRRLRGILVGASALLVLVGISAFPIPALVNEVRLGRKILELEQRRFEVEDMRQRVARLEGTLPGALKDLVRRINTAVPHVNSLLTIRNLVLAQAEAAGVEIHHCTFSSPILFKREIPDREGRSVIGSMEMNLQGAAPLENIFLLLGMIESTHLAFALEDLNITPALSGGGRQALRLGLKVFFRADPDQMAGLR
jgi:hypothetical protein